MMHICGLCGNNFTCNGGRGSACTCGASLVPRLIRRCLVCIQRDNGAAAGDNPFRVVGYVDPPQDFNPVYNVKEEEVCRCNKCEHLLGRVRFI